MSNRIIYNTIYVLVLLSVLLTLCGCETVKSMSIDWAIVPNTPPQPPIPSPITEIINDHK